MNPVEDGGASPQNDGLILVTGGTGTLGRQVLARLLEKDLGVRVLTRNELESSEGIEYVTGDLATGEGIDAAVAGVKTVIHLAGSQKGDGLKARTLVRAASGTGVTHLIYISVVGAERIPVNSRIDRAMFGYFESKRAAELVVAESGLPYSTLRATQFHELLLTMVRQMAKLPVIPVPSGFQFQPIAADEVAARLVELTFEQPAGLLPDMGGPRAYLMTELFRSYLKATRKHRLMLPLRLPGKAARAYRDGANLTPDHADGRKSWEQFLVEQVN